MSDSDDAEEIREIVARSFALLAASVHAKDPEDQIDIAADFACWIRGDEIMFTPANDIEETAARYTEAARVKLKKDKS